MNTAILVVAFALAVAVIVLAIIAIAARDATKLARTEANQIRTDFAAYESTHPYSEVQVRNLRERDMEQSRGTLDKAAEQIAPFFPEWPVELNPRDARYIGSPVDFVVFDGIEEDGDVNLVVVEVKTGTTRVDPRSPQERVRDAVHNGRVTWRELRLDLESTEVPELDGERPESPAQSRPDCT